MFCRTKIEHVARFTVKYVCKLESMSRTKVQHRTSKEIYKYVCTYGCYYMFQRAFKCVFWCVFWDVFCKF